MFLYQIFQNNLEIITSEFFITLIVLTILLFCVYLTLMFQTSKKITDSLQIPLIFYFLLFALLLNYYLPNSVNLKVNGVLIYDELSKFIHLILLASLSIYLLLQRVILKKQKNYYFEINILLLLSVLGLILLNSSYHLLALYLTLELQSLSFYVLAASNKNSPISAEAALKYFILGAIASGFILYGMSLIYGVTGTLNFGNIFLILTHINQYESLQFLTVFFYGLMFLTSGLLFKIGAAPFHAWLPDVYEGSPNHITAFFAIVPKIALIGLLIRIFFDVCNDIFQFFTYIFYFCSLFSIIIGSFVALQQKKIKRLLAYSSISHIGFILIGFTVNSYQSLQSILFYLVVYTIMTINIWSIFLSINFKNSAVKYLTELTNLSKLNPVLSSCLLINLFSMAGIPPLIGFFSKMFIFTTALKHSVYGLSIIGILLSVISAFYYIRLIKILYFDNSIIKNPIRIITNYEAFIIITTSSFILTYFLFPEYVLIYIQKLILLFIL